MYRTNKTILQIQEGFARLYQKKKWEDITVSEICEQAHVSRTTFYTYYSNIPNLLDEIESTILADIQDILNSWRYLDLSKWGNRTPAPVFIDIYRYVFYHRDFFLAVFGDYADFRFIDQYYDVVRNYFLEICRNSNTIRKNHELIAAMCSGAIFGLGRTWIRNGIDKVSIEELAFLNTRAIYGMIYVSQYIGVEK